MSFRLLLFDLDGTLLGPDREIRASTREALRELMAVGVHIGFATGRSPRSVQRYVDDLQPNGPLILFNGCMVWDPQDSSAVHEATLPRQTTQAALQLVGELGIHTNLYLGERLCIERASDVSRESEEKDGVAHEVVGELAAFFEQQEREATKLLLIDPSGDFAAMEERFAPHNDAGCTLVHSEPTYLEILPPGVNKGAALHALCKQYDFERQEIIAFGDGLNDLELLAEVGLGIAMGNAMDEVKDVARGIIGAHDTDAIANMLRGAYRAIDGRLVPE